MTTATQQVNGPKSTLGWIGMALGAVALLIAVIHFWGGPFSEQPSIEQTVAEKVGSIKDAAIAALKGEDAARPEQSGSVDMDRMIWLATSVLGALAIIFGLVGFARHESLRVAGGAAALGGCAMAFQFAVLAIGLIFIAILFAAVLHHFEF